MTGEGFPLAIPLYRTACAIASAVLLASCSSTADPLTRMGLSPQALSASVSPVATAAATSPDDEIVAAEAQTRYTIIGENDPVLPEQVNVLPRPRGGEVVASAPAGDQPAVLAAAAEPAPSQDEIAAIVQTRMGPGGPAIETAMPAPAAGMPSPQPKKKRGLFASLFGGEEAQQPASAAPVATQAQMAVAEAEVATGAAETPSQVSASAPALEPQPTVAAVAFAGNAPQEQQNITGPKKRGFLSGLFSQAEAAPARMPAAAPARPAAEPLLALASAPQPAGPRALVATEALPGVQENLFEITRKSGGSDDSDIDLHEGDDEYEVASAAGLARLAPNGLLMQTERVDVACLKPSLIRVLKAIEGHYGKKMLVTSGYRSPPNNRRARGARNSLHMYCAAADVQVAGVTKWELAEFVRSMPGRGGVGTYCHTDSVHVDVGPERDWNWRCRKRRK